jgi:beta-lactamase regulating signal transducer with metallopeptidase domain
MNVAAFFQNKIIAEGILNLALQSMVVLFLGTVLVKLVKSKSAPFRSALLLMIMTAGLLLPLLTFAARSLQIASIKTSLPAAWTAGAQAPPFVEIGAEPSTIPGNLAANETGPRTETRRSTTGSFLSMFSPLTPGRVVNILGIIWIGGFLFQLLRILFQNLSLSRFRRALLEVEDQHILGIKKRVLSKFPGMSMPGLYLSPAVSSPIALGIRRPIIVVPFHLYHTLSEREWKSILFHEMSHLYHKDQVVLLLQRLVLAVYWWNPLVYVISRDFSRAREEVSDNYAIREDSPGRYAGCLISLAEKSSLVSRLPAAIGMATPFILLEDRIKQILSKERIMKQKLSRSISVMFLTGAFLLPAILINHNYVFAEGDKIVPLPGVEYAVASAVADDELYISEKNKVLVYSLETFKLKSEIKIEGPVKPFSNYIIQNSRAYPFHWFTTGKEFIPRKVTWYADPYRMFDVIPMTKNSFLGLKKQTAGLWTVCLLNSKFETIKEIYKAPADISVVLKNNKVYSGPFGYDQFKMQKHNFRYDQFKMLKHYMGVYYYDNKIFIADSMKGFFIDVYKPDGTHLYSIKKDIKKIKVTDTFKQKVENYVKTKDPQIWKIIEKYAVYYDYFPHFNSITFDDNKIYVTTFKEKGGKHEIIVLDLKGNILKKVFVPFKSFRLFTDIPPLSIPTLNYGLKDNRLYQVLPKPSGDGYELHVTAIK